MYELMTFENILNRMLARVPSGIDKREGSIIYDACAPAAAELAQAYIELENIMNQTFADTAYREHLIRRAKERGISPYPAAHAILKGVFNMDVPIGSRFSLETLNYIAIEKISDGIYQMQCETSGEVGNQYFGRLIPIEHIHGLTSAEITELLIPGENEEGTENFRERYFNSLNAQAFGGNIQDYVEKALSLDGVGGIKVYPTWQGGGTVKLIIMDSQFKAPSLTLIEAVQTAFDPIPIQGQGLGLAPIGHTVTVAGISEETINTSTQLTLAAGYEWEMVRPFIETVIDEYFEELAKSWDKVNWKIDKTATVIVRISQIETRILSVQGVLDVADTRLNGGASNWTLGVDSIATRGIVSNG